MSDLTVKVYQDLSPEDPRNDYNLGTMYLSHKRYDLPDEIDNDVIRDGLESCRSWDEVKTLIESTLDVAVILPVYGYDHSGLFISTKIEPYFFHYAWDGGQLGFIYVTRDKLKEVFGWTTFILPKKRREIVEAQLRDEVGHYDKWLRSDVWGWCVENEDGEIIDSCWGIYDREYAEVDGHEALQSLQ